MNEKDCNIGKEGVFVNNKDDRLSKVFESYKAAYDADRTIFDTTMKHILDDWASPKPLPPRRLDQPIIEDLAREGDSVKFGVRYQLGHRIDESWIPAVVHCPSCGSSEVMVEDGPGDYYDGEKHVCLKCGSYFALHIYGLDGSEDRARLEVIRSMVKEVNP